MNTYLCRLVCATHLLHSKGNNKNAFLILGSEICVYFDNIHLRTHTVERNNFLLEKIYTLRVKNNLYGQASEFQILNLNFERKGRVFTTCDIQKRNSHSSKDNKQYYKPKNTTSKKKNYNLY
jgi:hypothetical protein